MRANEWLERLQEGDVVLVSGGLYGLREDRVRSVTRTQITVGVDTYRRDNGRGRGGARGDLCEATLERLQEIANRRRTNELVSMFGKVHWRSIPLATLEAMAALLPQENEETAP